MLLPRIYKPGVCPYCHSSNIEYDSNVMFEDCITWFFDCQDCGERSNEVYYIEYKYTEGENYAELV